MSTMAIEDPVRCASRLRVGSGWNELEYDGRIVELTPMEHALLVALLNAPVGGIAYGELAELLWGTLVANASGRIYVHTANLRAKLLACTGRSRLIRARHGRLRFDARLLGDCTIVTD